MSTRTYAKRPPAPAWVQRLVAENTEIAAAFESFDESQKARRLAAEVRIETDNRYSIRVIQDRRVVACAALKAQAKWHIAKRKGPLRLVDFDVVDTFDEAYGALVRLLL